MVLNLDQKIIITYGENAFNNDHVVQANMSWSRPDKNGWHFIDIVFKCDLLKQTLCFVSNVMKFVTNKGPIHKKVSLVKVLIIFPTELLNWDDKAQLSLHLK